ncbi:MAG: hypothetical protein F2534_06025 [Actinobacteria bacterium]|uniref:Unannotated protein n=1 Tax=freshwater metagenome TaxID=449393 RepID=A0A6J6CR21_9ZZZZ|nr:hypothetical protein [Actinomycetota bacterium]
MATTIFITVVLLRFALPLLIPRFPLPAVLACLVLDAADQTIFQAFTDDPLAGYQTYDKALDVYYLTVAYISAMRNWRDPVAFQVARFLFLYRLVGVTLFELVEQRWIIFVFANAFEYFFIAYEAVRTRWEPTRLQARHVVGLAVFIWVFVKLPQEWWIHLAKLDFTEFMADHPYMWGVLAVVFGVAGTVLYLKRSSIPPPDWPFTVDVDAHLPAIDETITGRERFWSVILAEKVVLLALISVIFAQILPDVRATNLGLALGVTVLVVANAAVSQWLRRRGRTWVGIVRLFVAMLLINLGIVFLDTLVSDRGDERPATNTLFFMLILSMLIALFDRFRATRREREGLDSIRDAWRRERTPAGG